MSDLVGHSEVLLTLSVGTLLTHIHHGLGEVGQSAIVRVYGVDEPDHLVMGALVQQQLAPLNFLGGVVKADDAVVGELHNLMWTGQVGDSVLV